MIDYSEIHGQGPIFINGKITGRPIEEIVNFQEFTQSYLGKNLSHYQFRHYNMVFDTVAKDSRDHCGIITLNCLFGYCGMVTNQKAERITLPLNGSIDFDLSGATISFMTKEAFSRYPYMIDHIKSLDDVIQEISTQ